MSKGHQDVQRRTWNKDEFETRAREREATERAGKKYKTQSELDKEDEKQRPPAQQLDGMSRPDMDQYDFKALVGQRRIVTAENALSEQGGFYCAPCDYLLKDQKSYLEHCNKPQHLAKMGLPMEVRRSTIDDIRDRLKSHKKTEKKVSAPPAVKKQDPAPPKKSERAVVEGKKQKEEKTKKQRTNDVLVEEALDFDPSAFGLPSSFGSTKK
jgi:uncharacterized C2H2 Zn-finger protein